jgi:sugar lactone lactonase YvrE
MATREFATLLDGGSFFEGPRWHDGRWWVSDFYRHLVLAVDTAGEAEEIVQVEGQPSGLGWTPSGELRIVSMKDHRLLELSAGGSLEVVADLTPWSGGPSNDMVVDGRGRAYVGNFGFDLMAQAPPAPATLVLVELDGSARPVADDLLFPNGAVVTPDGSTLIVGESTGSRYTAFDVADDGSLSGRRLWAQLAPTPGPGGFDEVLGALQVIPDGCCLDAEGCIWSADAAGGRAIRIAEGGEILDEVRVPSGMGVFACMLGGDDGRTLLLCTAPDFFEHLRSAAREAVLVTTTVEVPGAGWP